MSSSLPQRQRKNPQRPRRQRERGVQTCYPSSSQASPCPMVNRVGQKRKKRLLQLPPQRLLTLQLGRLQATHQQHRGGMPHPLRHPHVAASTMGAGDDPPPLHVVAMAVPPCTAMLGEEGGRASHPLQGGVMSLCHCMAYTEALSLDCLTLEPLWTFTVSLPGQMGWCMCLLCALGSEWSTHEMSCNAVTPCG